MHVEKIKEACEGFDMHDSCHDLCFREIAERDKIIAALQTSEVRARNKNDALRAALTGLVEVLLAQARARFLGEKLETATDKAQQVLAGVTEAG